MTEKRNIHALIEKEAPSLNNLLDPNDVKEFKELTNELRDTWHKKQVFRTETEMRFSVLNDYKHPTKASKYWQCVREQNSFLESLMSLSFDARRAEIKLQKLKKKLEKEKDPLEKERQFNIEYRAADASACPHLALAAIVHAGVQGIEDGLTAPKPSEEDLSLLSADELGNRGFVRLPETLEDALERMRNNPILPKWFPDNFLPVYLSHKTSEISHLANMDDRDRCKLYETTY